MSLLLLFAVVTPPPIAVLDFGVRRKINRVLPPEYRWPQPTPKPPHPLADVVVQAQIQGVVLPKNPVLAMALRKATERIVRPIRQKVVKVAENAITLEEEDDDDLFFFT